MPKLALLADPHSTHTFKWVRNLSKKGYTILLIGISDKTTDQYSGFKNVNCKCILVNKGAQKQNFISFRNLKHFLKLRREIVNFSPDILHSFYASSYGFIGAICHIKPFVISVWGSDIFEFPKKSFLHKRIIQYSLNKADRICATGLGLKSEIEKYTNQKIEVIPFGIDTNYFKPFKKEIKAQIIIGTVKHFLPVYGIETLIRAIAIINKENKNKKLKLLLVGDGPEKDNYIQLATNLGIQEDITFTGFVMNNQLIKQYQKMDLVVIPSLRESFGISVLEGMSCEIPVIASNISGFNEVGTNKTITYFEPGDSQDLMLKIKSFLNDNQPFKEKAHKARKRVIKHYSESASVLKKTKLYEQLLEE